MADLRALRSGEKRPVGRTSRRRRSVTTAARSGDRRRLLVGLRDMIASRFDAGIPAKDVAPLSRRLMAIAGEIAVIDRGKQDGLGVAAATPDEPWSPER